MWCWRSPSECRAEAARVLMGTFRGVVRRVGCRVAFASRDTGFALARCRGVGPPLRRRFRSGQRPCGAASAARAHLGPSPPFRRSSGPLRSPRPSPSRSSIRVLGSSPGVPQRSPLHRHHRARPLSVARGSGLPHPNTFHPCRSSRLRWLPPHTASRVCCTPLPVLGFARFPAGPTSLARARSDAPPSVASLPLRSSFPIEAGGLSPGSPASSSLGPPLTEACGFPRPRGLAPLSGPTPPGVTTEPHCSHSPQRGSP